MALQNISVIDLTIARAGPVAVRQLSDWGASVLRIEAPGAKDSLGGKHDSADYMNLHRNKRMMSLNLKSAEGLEIFRRLVAEADVLVENFRPPVKHRLKVDYESVAAINPRLVYGSISGFGQTGPRAEMGAVDQIIQGMSGLMTITGPPGEGPVRAGIAVSDVATGQQLAVGLLVALLERTQSGKGQWVQVSLLETMISFLDFQAARWTVDGEVAGQEGNLHPTMRPSGTFRAADGFLNVSASNGRAWERFCGAIDARDLLEDEDFRTGALRTRNWNRLSGRIEDALKQRTVHEWCTLFDSIGVPCGPVNSIDDMFAEPQVQHLAMPVEIDHPVRGPVSVIRQPVTMSRSERAKLATSPVIDQNTDEVLTELGYSEHDIETMRERGIV